MFKPATCLAFTATVIASAGVLASYFYITGPKKKRKAKLQGMVNLGNTCFANALLQSFAGCSTFASWFRTSKRITNSNLLHELSLVIDSINGCSTTKSIARNDNKKEENEDFYEEISAQGVIGALENRHWKIDCHIQHDLYELLNVFITTWDEEICQYNTSTQKITSLGDVCNIISEKVNSTKEEIKGVELLHHLADVLGSKTFQKSPCSGLIATQFICTSCGHKHVRQDKFCTLSLSLPNAVYRPCLTLEHCLRKYFAVEKLYNVTCDRCKEKSTNPAIGKSNFYKNSGLSKLPDCLILHLDRVNWLPNGSAYKQDDHVQFEEYLDVSNFLFYNNNDKMSHNLIKPISIAGGKASKRNGGFERGDFSTSNLNHLSSISRNIGGGGLQQYPTVLHANKSLNSSGDINNFSPNQQNSKNGDETKTRHFQVATKKNLYQLKAVAAHLGDHHDSGHFVTYRRGSPISTTAPSSVYNNNSINSVGVSSKAQMVGIDSSNDWYFTSDSDIKRTRFETDVAHCQAYMLFYERMNVK